MKIKRAVIMAVLAVAVAALAVPLVSLRARAAGSSAKARPPASAAQPSAAAAKPVAPAAAQQNAMVEDVGQSSAGEINPEVINMLGIKRLPKGTDLNKVNQMLERRLTGGRSGGSDSRTQSADATVTPQSGQPLTMNTRSALSAALVTTIGGRDTQFSEVALIADWDGREDCTADREQKQADFSPAESAFDIDFTFTKAAISEHTVANGFNENVIYYGDSVGNFWIGTDLNPGVSNAALGAVDFTRRVNIPDLVRNSASGGFTLLNPIAGDCVDDQVTITGIAVNPVADLADFGFCGEVGEVVYVSTLDTESCASAGTNNRPVRTRIFAFAFGDNPAGQVCGAAGVEGLVPRGAIQLLRSPNANIAGLTVDDDGSLYFQLVDLINLTTGAGAGGAIFQVTELCRTTPASCAGAGGPTRVNRVIASIPGGLTNDLTVTSTAPNAATGSVAGGFRLTNYSGTSPTFGNIVAIDAGPCNVIYAAVARSFVAGDVTFDQLTQGLFTNPSALGATPSMVISFADCRGAFDACSLPAAGLTSGAIPIADGFADPATGTTSTAGVNNFRVFATGLNPNIIPASSGAATTPSGSAVIPGTRPDVLRLDMQVDFSLHSGIAVNEEGTVFVISGGTPAGIGKNPSPMLGEILCFPDMCPMDRRADFIDFRGDANPNPPDSAGSPGATAGGVPQGIAIPPTTPSVNVGDGDSDRFDHIFYQAPFDQVTFTPTGLSGLATGFLRYTNRLAPCGLGLTPGAINLGVTERVLGDDDFSGFGEPGSGTGIIFERLDPGHQVAGGDDQNFPFRGDDNDGAGTPVLTGALEGGFEFLFGGPVSTANCVWNGFFLNSNGNITFGQGDTSPVADLLDFRQGAPRIAPAWTDLNPNSRAVNSCTFPVQALGFANVNAFKIRWINVPETGFEACVGAGGGRTNTFAVTLFDDGTARDENEAQILDPADPTGDNVDPAFDELEGPTDLQFVREPNTGVLIGCPPRPDGTGHFLFEYCRMDLLGGPGGPDSPTSRISEPVIAGFSLGNRSPNNPPGLCEIDLSEAAREADAPGGTFGVIQGTTASIMPCLIGEGTEPTLFELFNSGLDPRVGTDRDPGEILFAAPDFDLRFEGNEAGACKPLRQADNNRSKVGFFGVGCTVPGDVCVTITTPTISTPGAVIGRPGSTGLINAICDVQLNIVGCGFFPNETTEICQGVGGQTGQDIVRAGKTVNTQVTLVCVNTNASGVPDATTSTVQLLDEVVVSKNLIRARLGVPGASLISGLTGSAFPIACCGGNATVTVTTSFSSGDNNVFGPFTRTTTCTLPLGNRAPIVKSVTPSEGNCAIPQDVLISGACFIINGVSNVTSVFAVRDDGAVTIVATPVNILSANLIDAFFNFTSANAGRRFFIFVSGPNGVSRNLGPIQAPTVSPLPAPNPANPAQACLIGNEEGVQVTFTCAAAGTTPNPNPNPNPLDLAVVNGCRLDRQANGAFVLNIFGRNFKSGATVTIGNNSPKKVQFKDLDSGTNTFTRLKAKGGNCRNLPGAIVVTNPGPNGGPSQPFQCNDRCPNQ